MNTIRILLNGILTFLSFSGGIYLLDQGSFFLRDRWHPETGMLFRGPALYLLAFGLFFLGAFAATVTVAWMKGSIPTPDSRQIRPHPVFKGQIIFQYWYLIFPALILIVSAFLLA